MEGLAFHPDGVRMFSGDSWGQLCAWNYAEAEPKPLWKTVDGHRGWMRGFALSPDGSLLATCASDRKVKLWSTADGTLKQDVATHPEDLFSVRFHPDGKSLVWGDMKGVATHWDLASSKIVRTLDARVMYLRPEGMPGVPEINDVGGIRSFAFDPEGKTLACIGCQPLSSGFVQAKPLVVLLDWETGKETQRLMLPDANGNDGIAYDALFHPAGYVVAASSGQTGPRGLWFWKPGEKAPAHVEKALPHCRSVTLHKDGNRLAVAQVTLKKGALTGNVKAEKKGEYPGAVSTVHLFETQPAPT
jgi:WD40 repeat protein